MFLFTPEPNNARHSEADAQIALLFEVRCGHKKTGCAERSAHPAYICHLLGDNYEPLANKQVVGI